jgi:hypothetical protein
VYVKACTPQFLRQFCSRSVSRPERKTINDAFNCVAQWRQSVIALPNQPCQCSSDPRLNLRLLILQMHAMHCNGLSINKYAAVNLSNNLRRRACAQRWTKHDRAAAYTGASMQTAGHITLHCIAFHIALHCTALHYTVWAPALKDGLDKGSGWSASDSMCTALHCPALCCALGVWPQCSVQSIKLRRATLDFNCVNVTHTGGMQNMVQAFHIHGQCQRRVSIGRRKVYIDQC